METRKSIDPQGLVNDIAEWSDAQFGESWVRVLGMSDHLVEESTELRTAVSNVVGLIQNGHTYPKVSDITALKEHILEEAADNLMLLMDITRKMGFSFDDLLHATTRKLEINKDREWGDADGKSKVKHIEPMTDKGMEKAMVSQSQQEERSKLVKKIDQSADYFLIEDMPPYKYIAHQVKHDPDNKNLKEAMVEVMSYRILTNLIPLQYREVAAAKQWLNLYAQPEKRTMHDARKHKPLKFRIHARNQFTAMLLDGFFIPENILEEYKEDIVLNRITYHRTGLVGNPFN